MKNLLLLGSLLVVLALAGCGASGDGAPATGADSQAPAGASRGPDIKTKSVGEASQSL